MIFYRCTVFFIWCYMSFYYQFYTTVTWLRNLKTTTWLRYIWLNDIKFEHDIIEHMTIWNTMVSCGQITSVNHVFLNNLPTKTNFNTHMTWRIHSTSTISRKTYLYLKCFFFSVSVVNETDVQCVKLFIYSDFLHAAMLRNHLWTVWDAMDFHGVIITPFV